MTTETTTPAPLADDPRTRAEDIPREVDVLVVGGGPVGSLLAALLARRGVRTLQVEKQTSIARDFRGETIASPSVVALKRLGFGPALRQHGYLETEAVTTVLEGKPVFRMDYTKFGGSLPIDIPQPSIIQVFNDEARRHPRFDYGRGWAFQDILTDEQGAVVGARIKSPEASVELHCRLVVGADGRFSKVRKAAGFEARVEPMGRDFLWFLLPRPADWGHTADLVVRGNRHIVVLPTFPDRLRIGHNLPKKGFAAIRSKGMEAFKDSIAELDPRLEPLLRQQEMTFEDCGFLDIFTAELPRWSRDGLLLVGDASHTGTPILGQGVNMGMTDAIELVPHLVNSLATPGTGPLPAADFSDFVERRRRQKTRVTGFQRIQEAQLALDGRREQLLRRARYAVLNTLPGVKYALIGRAINVPVQIDPVDVRLGAHAAAVRAGA